ncbi:MAG: DNA polymerase I [Elusimicrobia bacterium]|nr:DNA polymerase I [Elusimicrobiota bacterium]
MSESVKNEERIYLIDAHAYLHRAYHALPPLTTSDGLPVGALFGFARMLLALIRREKPEFLAVCFDAPGPTFRHKIYERYKATRKPIDEDLKKQLALARDMVEAMGLRRAEMQGWEADDLIATMAERAAREGLRVLVVSGDKDALQLVGENVKVLNEAKGIVLDSGGVLEKFGVEPSQIVDYLSLTGDASDNVPGAPGIGPVGAAKLLKRFGTLEEILKAAAERHPDVPAKAAESLCKAEEQVRFGRELVTLDFKAPVELAVSDCRLDFRPSGKLAEMLGRLEFRSLLKELGLDAPAGAAGSAAPSILPAPKEVSPRELLKAAGKSNEVALAAAAREGGLLESGGLELALALEGGKAACFSPDDLRACRQALGKLLESPEIRKAAYDLKEAMRLLGAAGFRLAGPVFDARIAGWCLEPSRSKPDIRALAQETLGAGLPEDAGASVRAAVLPALSARLEGLLKEKGLRKVYEELELPLVEILAGMEEAGVALDVEYLGSLKGEFAGGIEALKKEIDELSGFEVNLNSPKQIGELLFSKLGLKPLKKTKGGAASTDEGSLSELAAKHPVPAKILSYRELAKLQSTYVEGLLAKVLPSTRRVHTHFNQTGTATGRLSSLEPNLQNIPVRTPMGQKIRRAFVAEKGCVLLSADYSQIELRVLAHLSKDPALRCAFASGQDIHLRTAAEVFGVEESAVTKEMRRRAKTVNFGIIYGQTPHGLSKELGIPMGEAKSAIERYFARYKGVEAWIRGTVEEARRERSVRTIFGRVRHIPDIAAKNFAVRSFAERAAVNAPIQGSAADIIKAAMIAIHRGLPSRTSGRLVLQVHDELLFELPKGEVKAFAAWARGVMEAAVRLDVPVVVDVKAGPNWRDMEVLPS